VAHDPHQLQPDHHPTPFSADEIRDAFVPGRITRSRVVEGPGADPVVRVRRNVRADAETGTYAFWTEGPDGERAGEIGEHPSTWLELQSHASMPVELTTIEAVVIDIPMGTFKGLLYTRTDGKTVDRFWFATDRPGAPVRMEEHVDGELVYSSTAIEERDP
jgi:hypothetical protein